MAEGQKRQLKGAELSAARVLEEMRRVSFANMKGRARVAAWAEAKRQKPMQG